MNLYLDSSGIVKRYLEEPGSAEVEARLVEAAQIASSLVAYAEVAAAIAGARRRGDARAEDADEAWRLFRVDWADFVVMPVDQPTVEAAAALVRDHRLRGFDAVHLASAIQYADALGLAVGFATFDRQLWRAARAAGLEPWPPGLGD